VASEFKRNAALFGLHRTLHLRAPTSADWIYELKMDGYQLIVRRLDDKARIDSRRGADFTPRFSRIVDAVRRLKARSVLLDGEGIVYDQHGMPPFDLIHSKQYDREVSLVAFDLLEIDGQDCPARGAERPQAGAGQAGGEGQKRHRVQRPP
jgi:ATP-dependent DNA ligase